MKHGDGSSASCNNGQAFFIEKKIFTALRLMHILIGSMWKMRGIKDLTVTKSRTKSHDLKCSPKLDITISLRGFLIWWN